MLTMNLNYRKRIYQSYLSTIWSEHHSENRREYEIFSKYGKKQFTRFLPEDKNARIIDIAFGGGHFLYFLQKEGYENAHGIDISGEMTALARRMGIRRVERGDLFRYLPKRKRSYDMIIANDIIEHLTKQEVFPFLELILSALRPGGTALLSLPNAQSLLGGRARYIDFTHEIGFTPLSALQIMRVAGFKSVKVYGEKPVAHDVRSAIRAALWDVLDKIFRVYIMIEGGTGRGSKKGREIFEPRIIAIGKKPDDDQKKR